MKLDIVFVLYNSEKWIDNCLKSINKSDYNLKNISLYFADNNSNDNTVSKIEEFKNNNQSKYNDIKLLKLRKNKGFGYGNNQAAKLGNSKYILFLNVDTEIFPDTLSKLEKEINSSTDNIGIFELSQMPYEHPKYYDPLTWETDWSSGACMIIRRDIFNKCKGFDTNLFMYCEDVELSFHVRMLGYKIKYLPNNSINHYCYKFPGEDKYISRMYTPANNYYLRCKYGTFLDRHRGRQLNRTFIRQTPYPEKKFMTIKIIKMLISYLKALLFVNKKDFNPLFINYDFSYMRGGAFYEKKAVDNEPLVSIIVRTHNRPLVLRETLISLRNQIYKNFEICVVEDGKDTASKMIKEEFKDLNIKYKATNTHVGRCEVANIGMSMAKGKYLNFLDDDDFFFADHISIMVGELEKGDYNIVFSLAIEEKIDIIDSKNYKYKSTNKWIAPSPYYSQLDIFKANCFPIQSVMFKKSILNQMIDNGKFDINLDCYEDWDFWIRMGLIDMFHRIDKVTSVYRTPANPTIANERTQKLISYTNYVYNKYKKLNVQMTLEKFIDTRYL